MRERREAWGADGASRSARVAHRASSQAVKLPRVARGLISYDRTSNSLLTVVQTLKRRNGGRRDCSAESKRSLTRNIDEQTCRLRQVSKHRGASPFAAGFDLRVRAGTSKDLTLMV